MLCKTLIHEASHRFANTYDLWYFGEDLEKNPGSDLESRKFAEMYQNADSYGWSCLLVYEQLCKVT
jgi:hypothetical protein